MKSFDAPGASVLDGIQLLRGLAAAMVVAHTSWRKRCRGGIAIPAWLITAGASGVEIFFAISGCIKVQATFREGKLSLTLRAFFLGRIIRIILVAWIACAALFLLLHARNQDEAGVRGSVLALPLRPGAARNIPSS